MRRTRLSDGVLRWLLAAAALVVVVAGLRAAAALLVPLAIAGIIAITIQPLVSWLEGRTVPTWLAVGLTLTALLVALLGPGLIVQRAAMQFLEVAPAYAARLAAMTVAWSAWLDARGVDVAPLADVVNWTAGLNLVGGMFANVAFLLSNAFLVLLVVGFALMEAQSLPQTIARAFSVDPAATDRVHRVTAEVHRYLRVKTAVSLATGILIGLWTALLGVDFAVLWGLLAFLLNFIPNVGSIVAAVPPVLLSLVQLGVGSSAAVAAGFIAVNMVLGNIVEPYVMGRRLRISPLVVVIALVFWGWAWGSVGMVLAVPLTMIARILCETSADLRWVAVLIAGGEHGVSPAATSTLNREP